MLAMRSCFAWRASYHGTVCRSLMLATVSAAGGHPIAFHTPVRGDCKKVYGYTISPLTAEQIASVKSP